MKALLNIDRRILYLVVAAALILATAFPFSLPIKASKPVLGVYNRIEQLKAGDVLMVSLDFDPASKPELAPMSKAILRQAFRKKLRVIGLTHWPSGVPLAGELILDTAREFDEVQVAVRHMASLKEARQAAKEKPATGAGALVKADSIWTLRALAKRPEDRLEVMKGKGAAWSRGLFDVATRGKVGTVHVVKAKADGTGKDKGSEVFVVTVAKRTATKIYGKDYCYLGQRAGMSVLIITMGQSLQSAFPTDKDGTPTRDLAMLQDVQSLRDVDYLICIAAGATGEAWIAYGAERYKFPMGIGCTAVIAPDLYPYYQSHQITGIIGGIKGAWEYEQKIGVTGSATEAVPAQTVAHLLVIALIVLCNISYFLSRRKNAVT